MANVFVYGTLMAEEVVDVLIRRQPRKVPGTKRKQPHHVQCILVVSSYPCICSEQKHRERRMSQLGLYLRAMQGLMRYAWCSASQRL